jgi:uronate dehydrogenase
MKRVLLTGASGDVGTRLRKLLKPIYPELILSDIRTPAELGPDETFVPADISKFNEVANIVQGVEGIIHLGGFSVEGPWETILNANIIGAYNVYEAARQAGVKRIIFASSNHAAGFYPREKTIGTDVTLLPDSRYGLSKMFGEGLASLYAYKHGLGSLVIRIGNVGDRPLDKRRLSIWLKTEDLLKLIRIGLEKPDLLFEVVYGMSDNKRAWWDNSRAKSLGYQPEGKSEDFAEAVLQAEKPSTDEVAAYYQGGPFCSDAFDADFERLKKLTS